MFGPLRPATARSSPTYWNSTCVDEAQTYKADSKMRAEVNGHFGRNRRWIVLIYAYLWHDSGYLIIQMSAVFWGRRLATKYKTDEWHNSVNNTFIMHLLKAHFSVNKRSSLYHLEEVLHRALKAATEQGWKLVVLIPKLLVSFHPRKLVFRYSFSLFHYILCL